MTSWTVRRHRRADATTSLYCFPHAGGSPGEYVRWSDDLPDVRVWGVHLPGRTTRRTEPPFTRMEPLVDALVSAVSFENPFVLFGHSLGALVAFETAKELRRRGHAQPSRLIVSSCPAPSLVPPVRRPVRASADDELLDEMERSWGESLDHLRADPDLRAHVLACYRADFTLLEQYSHEPDDRPFDCPVTVLAGTEELWTPRAGDWAAYTSGPTEVELLPGGHFYFRDGRREAMRALRKALSTTAR